jgi:hypothetical protein
MPFIGQPDLVDVPAAVKDPSRIQKIGPQSPALI